MTPKRFYYLMIVFNILSIIIVLAIVYFANQLIKTQADKLVTARTTTKVAEEKQTALIQAKKDIDKYGSLNEIARSIVPQDKDQAKTVREINKLASESGIVITDIKFQTSNLGQKVPVTLNPDGTPSANGAPPISQVKSVEGIKGVYTLEINVTSSESKPVPYNQFVSFLEKLENNRRTAHVSQITIRPNEILGGVSFSLTLNAYVKP